MVKYIFTDKTGTLTQNKMELSKVSIDGQKYQNDAIDTHQEGGIKPLSPLMAQCMMDNDKTSLELQFFNCLLLNGATILTNKKTDERNVPNLSSYSSPSPDEIAFAQALSTFGFVFYARKTSPNAVVIRYILPDGKQVDQKYVEMGVLEFQSKRKRMTVIMHDETEDRYFLY
eukprot:UN24033